MTVPGIGVVGSVDVVGGVHVVGGVDGLAARTSDIDALRTVVAGALDAVENVRDTLLSFDLVVSLACAASIDPVGAAEVGRQLAELRDGLLTTTRTELDGLQVRLVFAAASYEETESGVFGAISGFVEHVGLAAWDATTSNFGGAADQLFRSAPFAVDLAMSQLRGLEPVYSAMVPDGRPVLDDLGIDARAGLTDPPRTLDGLVSDLALRDDGAPGEISVALVTAADGHRCAIVDIPGTKSWNPLPNPNITSVGTDIRALTGQPTAYEDGVLEALTAAGVGSDTDVMLVGHSEGGIVAVNAARHAAASGQFRVTNVVTAGAPIGRLVADLPDSVQVLALENSADVMPSFDAAANPDRPNITTVTIDDEHDDIGANHSLGETYLGESEIAERSGNASIDAFLGSADEYLTGSHMMTHVYRITRDP